jgi:hypothetical protein
MSKTSTDEKHDDPIKPLQRRERSSPGSGEEDETADLQPDDVEDGDQAR